MFHIGIAVPLFFTVRDEGHLGNGMVRRGHGTCDLRSCSRSRSSIQSMPKASCLPVTRTNWSVHEHVTKSDLAIFTVHWMSVLRWPANPKLKEVVGGSVKVENNTKLEAALFWTEINRR